MGTASARNWIRPASLLRANLFLLATTTKTTKSQYARAREGKGVQNTCWVPDVPSLQPQRSAAQSEAVGPFPTAPPPGLQQFLRVIVPEKKRKAETVLNGETWSKFSYKPKPYPMIHDTTWNNEHRLHNLSLSLTWFCHADQISRVRPQY